MPADISRTIELIVSVVDHSSAAVASLNRNVNSMGKSASAASSAVSGVRKETEKLVPVVTAAGGGMQMYDAEMKAATRSSAEMNRSMAYVMSNVFALISALSMLLFPSKEASEFEVAMARVGATMGATSEQFSQLTQVAAETGRTTLYTAVQAAEGLQLLARAGFSASQAIEALPAVLNLAMVGEVGLAESADYASSIMYSMGLQAKDLAHVNDALVNTFTSTNSSLQDIGESMKYVGPIASAVGESINALSAAVGILANNGIKGSMAGTTLRQAISRLVEPTPRAAAALDELGHRIGQATVKVFDAQGQFVGLANIVDQLSRAAMTTGEAMTIFGVRAGQGMVALSNTGAEALRELTKANEEADGAAQRYADTVTNTLYGSIKLMISAVNGMAIALGNVVTPTIRWFAEQVTIAANAISGFATSWPRLAAMFYGMAASLAIVTALTAGWRLLLTALNYVMGQELIASMGGVVKGLAAIAVEEGIVNAALSALAVTIGALEAFLTSWAGIAIIAVGALYTMATASSRAAQSFDDMAQSFGAHEGQLVQISKAAGQYYDKLLELSKAEKDGKDIQEEKSKLLEEMIKQFPELSGRIDTATASTNALAGAMKTLEIEYLTEQIKKGVEQIDEVIGKLSGQTDGLMGAIRKLFFAPANSSAVIKIFNELSKSSGALYTNLDSFKNASPVVQSAFKAMYSAFTSIENSSLKAGYSVEQFKQFLADVAKESPQLAKALTDLYKKQFDASNGLVTAKKQEAQLRVNNIAQLKKETEEYKASYAEQSAALKLYEAQQDELVAKGKVSVEEAERAKAITSLAYANTRYQYELDLFKKTTQLYNSDDKEYQKAKASMLKAEEGYVAAKTELAKIELAQSKKKYEKDQEDLKIALNANLEQVKLDGAERLDFARTTEEKKATIEKQYYKDAIQRAQDYLAKLKESYPENVDAQREMVAKIADLKIQEADFEIEQIQRVHDKKEAMADADLALMEAENNKKKAQLEKEVVDRVTTAEEAGKQIDALDAGFAQAKMDRAEEVFLDAKDKYAWNTAEYKKALADLEKAEAEYIDFQTEAEKKKQEAMKKTADAAKASSLTQINAVKGIVTNVVEASKEITVTYKDIADTLAEAKKSIGNESLYDIVIQKKFGVGRQELKEFKSQVDDVVKFLEDAFNVRLNPDNLKMEDIKKTFEDFVSVFSDASATIRETGISLDGFIKNMDLANGQINDSVPTVDDFNKQFQKLQSSIEALRNTKFTGVEDLKSALSDVNASYKEIVSTGEKIITSLAKQISDLKGEWNKYNSVLETTRTDMQTIAETTAKYRDDLKDIPKYLTESQDPVETLKKSFEELRSASLDVSRFRIDGVDEANSALGRMVTAYDAVKNAADNVLSDLKAKWQALKDQIDSIKTAMLSLQQDTADKIRVLQEATMTDYQKYLAERQRADTIYQQGLTALQKGSYNEAYKYFQQAMDLASQLGSEIKDQNGNVVVSLTDVTNTSIAMIKKASGEAAKALKLEQQETVDNQKNIASQIRGTIANITQAGQIAGSAISSLQDQILAQQTVLNSSVNQLMHNAGLLAMKLQNIKQNAESLSRITGTDLWTKFLRANPQIDTQKFTNLFTSGTVNSMGEGGLLSGKKHSQGGILINAEDKEFIEPADTVAEYGPSIFEAFRRKMVPKSLVSLLLGELPIAESGGLVAAISKKVDMGLSGLSNFAFPEPKILYAQSGGLVNSVPQGSGNMPIKGYHMVDLNFVGVQSTALFDDRNYSRFMGALERAKTLST